MKEKYQTLFSSITEQMEKLTKKQIKVEEAKAFASLAKQANNVLAQQLDTAKFINTAGDKATKLIDDVGI